MIVCLEGKDLPLGDFWILSKLNNKKTGFLCGITSRYIIFVFKISMENLRINVLGGKKTFRVGTKTIYIVISRGLIAPFRGVK